jgi:hypothetical protein
MTKQGKLEMTKKRERPAPKGGWNRLVVFIKNKKL